MAIDWAKPKDSDINIAKAHKGGFYIVTGPHNTPGYYDLWWALQCIAPHGNRSTTHHNTPELAIAAAETADLRRRASRESAE